MKLKELHETVHGLVNMVLDGDLPGLFVVGPGGLGKSHAVLGAFSKRGVSAKTLNTHATAFGLYTELYELRDEKVVLLEDLEELYTSLPALSLLRGLLWGPRKPDGSMRRLVTWTSRAVDGADVPESFEFNAGIVMTANRFPTGNDVFNSLRTRVPVVRFDVEKEEIFAFMREMVVDGFTVFGGKEQKGIKLEKAECLDVISFLESRGACDLRMLLHGLSLYHRHREERGWHRFLEAIVTGVSPLPSNGRGNGRIERATARPEGNERELRVVRDLLSREELSVKDRVSLFMEETGKSRETFFRRQRELRETHGTDGVTQALNHRKSSLPTLLGDAMTQQAHPVVRAVSSDRLEAVWGETVARAAVPAAGIAIAHLGCQHIFNSVKRKRALIPEDLKRRLDERYGASWTEKVDAADCAASAVAAGVAEAGLDGATLIDTMQGGSDYWRPGKLITDVALALRTQGRVVAYARDDALCPEKALLDRFRADKSMRFGDYAESYAEALTKYEHAALRIAAYTAVASLARRLLPVFYCTDPYVPGYTPPEGDGFTPYRERAYPEDDIGFYRERGCHRVVLTECLARFFRSLGVGVTVHRLNANAGSSYARAW